ncbi:oligosaccharide flippase family protein [Amycolatopsis anabasis]|uniref:oligosaccharide flippase family protein n=1 Tax=Amycolatopsis anabasis TaxID=1840409 RepID=UPI00131E9154|nr:oligosaccharide flippase family protein [Amycolatopsis anabasis]
MSERLATAAVRGSLWLGLINLISKGSQVVVTVALAAFLTEGDLGLVTFVVSLVNIGQVVQSMGVYDLISRAESDPGRTAGIVLTLSVGTALVLTGVLLVTARPIAALLGSPATAGLLQFAALCLPFSAVGGVQMGLMHRELNFRRRLFPDAGSAVLGAVVTVVLAVCGEGPRALVFGLLCTAIAQPLFAFLAGVRVRPRWDRARAGEALRWVGVVGPAAIVAALLLNVGYPVIGHVLGPEVMGSYSLAYRIASVPLLTVAVVLGAVAFPVYSRLIRSGRSAELPVAVGRFTWATLVATGGLYLVAAALGDRVVLLGERWSTASGVLVVLCAHGLATCLLQGWYEAIRAAGRPRSYLVLQCLHLLVLLVALASLTRFGVLAAAASHVLAVWLLLPVAWFVLMRLDLAPSARGLARQVTGLLVAALVSAVPVLVLDGLGCFGPPTSVLGALAEAVVLLTAYAAATVLTQRKAVQELCALRTRRGRSARLVGGQR